MINAKKKWNLFKQVNTTQLLTFQKEHVGFIRNNLLKNQQNNLEFELCSPYNMNFGLYEFEYSMLDESMVAKNAFTIWYKTIHLSICFIKLYVSVPN